MNFMKKIWMLVAVATLLVTCDQKRDDKQVAKASFETSKRYEDNWESIKQYEIPEWFANSKFGIFIHWGVYSVPAYGSEWYPRLMYQEQEVKNANGEVTKKENELFTHHVETWGDPSKFGYKDFIPMFKAEKFDADEWLNLFKASGAKYIVPVAEHHDGFAMYKSSHTRWNSVDMGPKQDIIQALSDASKKHGMKFGVSSHFAFNWNYFTKKEGWDTSDPQYADLYSRPHDQYAPCDEEFLKHWWDRTTEIIDNYQPDILWFDFYIDNKEFVPYHPKMAAYYYNKGMDWNKEVVLQTKNFDFESFPSGSNVLDIERGKLPGISKYPWQTDTSIGKNSWGFVDNWISKDPNTLIDDLVDIVSKNGCMLLNVGPKADGTIPDDQREVLLTMGKWIGVNGEAIYDTKPWVIFGEGPTKVEKGHHSEKKNKNFSSEDIRFTKKGDKLFAIVMAWPESGKVVIKALKNNNEYKASVKSLKLLGFDGELQWNTNDQGLEITMPSEKIGEFAHVIEMKI